MSVPSVTRAEGGSFFSGIKRAVLATGLVGLFQKTMAAPCASSLGYYFRWNTTLYRLVLRPVECSGGYSCRELAEKITSCGLAAYRNNWVPRNWTTFLTACDSAVTISRQAGASFNSSVESCITTLAESASNQLFKVDMITLGITLGACIGLCALTQIPYSRICYCCQKVDAQTVDTQSSAEYQPLDEESPPEPSQLEFTEDGPPSEPGELELTSVDDA